MDLNKFLQQIGFILILCLFISLGVHFPLIKKYLQGEFRYSFLPSEEFPSITFISLAEAMELFSKKEVLFIDDRTEEAFREGHILGALSIPFVLGKVEEGSKLLACPLEKTLVVYCDGSKCQSSVELAKFLHKQGFKDIRVFFGGWAEWVKEGLPISSEYDSQ